MTTFYRRGHYRRGPNGQRVWVTGHSVTRNGSPIAGRAYIKSTRSVVVPSRTWVAMPRPTTRTSVAWTSGSARWLIPNAFCPVCGAHVFFYANEFGSRVYFDEIGPPWPKHPCTDTRGERGVLFDHDRALMLGATRIEPARYKDSVGRKKMAEARHDFVKMDAALPDYFTSHIRATAYEVESVVRNERTAQVCLRQLYEKSPAEIWGTGSAVVPEIGQVVFVYGGELSYLEIDRIRVVRISAEFLFFAKKKKFFDRILIRLDR